MSCRSSPTGGRFPDQLVDSSYISRILCVYIANVFAACCSINSTGTGLFMEVQRMAEWAARETADVHSSMILDRFVWVSWVVYVLGVRVV